MKICLLDLAFRSHANDGSAPIKSFLLCIVLKRAHRQNYSRVVHLSDPSCKPWTAQGTNPPGFFSSWIILPCFSASCVSPLGLESGEITDEALSHSLPASEESKPQYIRLNMDVTSFPYGWRSRLYQDPPDYLQIDFGSLRKVTRLSTMGGYGSFYYDRYVATYKLSHSKNGLTWVEYRENGEIKVSGLKFTSTV